MGLSAEEVTQLLAGVREGNQEAISKLIPLVYNELRRLAKHYMRTQRSDHTLQPTALVNEAYIRLIKSPVRDWQDRNHFFAAAAMAMRSVLVEYARKRRTDKRAGLSQKVVLDEELVVSAMKSEELLYRVA